MGTHRQTLLDQFTAVEAFLCGEAGVHSDDLMSGTFSLGSQDIEKRAPTGVQDRLRQMMVFHHGGDLKVFHNYTLIAVGIGPGCLEMVISSLPVHLQVRLGNVARSLTLAVTTFFSAAHDALFPSQRPLRGAIEAGILNRVALAVSQEGFQAHINTDVRVRTRSEGMLRVRISLTHDERIPMPISPMHQVNGFGCSLYRAMELDLEEMPHLLGDNQLFAVLMQLAVFSIVSQLDTMPAIWLLEPREAYTRNVLLLGGNKALKRLRETISQHLDGGGRNLLALSLKSSFQVILAWEGTIFLIVRLDRLKHLIIDKASLFQALHEHLGLFPVHVQAILKCSHADILVKPMRNCKGDNSPTWLEASGPLVAFW